MDLLHLSAFHGHLEIVQWLVNEAEGGALLVHDRNVHRRCPLVSAAYGGQHAVLKWLWSEQQENAEKHLFECLNGLGGLSIPALVVFLEVFYTLPQSWFTFPTNEENRALIASILDGTATLPWW
eukprot:TRINITY_DN97502_c0_g1_i1.p1 TRINITY_DN97502_c0_g1~~TRINITY_DN97502_c0_g1_i1.p1  ORF type:complete len:124 (-),score=2.34 TRINITY_DN97502_c0_g1_i1:62-433(-)